MKTRKNKQNNARNGKRHRTKGASSHKRTGKKGRVRSAWVRDGYESYMHYLADVKTDTLLFALTQDAHPFLGIAKSAKEAGLI